MDVFISVIVPIYNGIEYINECVQSFSRQSSNNFELILIDDGSTDDSLILIEKLKNKYDFIKSYHQENGGVSVARNLGITKAIGNVVTFVDVDDHVSDDFVDFIEKHIKDYDVILFDAFICKDEAKTPINKLFERSGDFSSDKNKEKLISQCISYRYGDGYKPKYHGAGAIWGKAFKAPVIKGLRFVQGLRMSEDTVFVIESIMSAKSIYYFNKPLYYYRSDNPSASRSFDDRYIDTNTLMYNCFRDVLLKYGLLNSYGVNKAFQHRILTNIINVLRNYVFNKKTRFRKQVLNKLYELEWVDNALINFDRQTLDESGKRIINNFSKHKYMRLKIYFSIEAWLRLIKRKIRS